MPAEPANPILLAEARARAALAAVRNETWDDAALGVLLAEAERLTAERNTYHTFAQHIAALVAPPDAVDVAVTHLAPSDLDALAETVAEVLATRAKHGRLAGLEEAAQVAKACRGFGSASPAIIADQLRALAAKEPK